MSFTTVCPGCDARLTAPDALRGKKVKCKKCGDAFVARASGDDDEDESPARSVKASAKGPPPRPRSKPSRNDEDEPTEEGEPVRGKKSRRRPPDDDTEVLDAAGDGDPRRGKKKKGKKKSGPPVLLLVLLGVGAILLIGGGAVGAYFAFFNEEEKNTDTQAKGGTTAASSGGAAPAGTWVEHVDAEGRFRIKFPKQPVTQNQTINIDGVQQTLKITQHQNGPEVFVANAVVIPDPSKYDPEVLLDTAENQATVRIAGSTLTSKKPITHAGINGREIVLSIQKGTLTGIVRVFVANDRIYTIGVVGPPTLAVSPNVATFFNSLKFE